MPGRYTLASSVYFSAIVMKQKKTSLRPRLLGYRIYISHRHTHLSDSFWQKKKQNFVVVARVAHSAESWMLMSAVWLCVAYMMCVVDKQRYTHTLKHEQHIKIAISREFLEFLKIATKVEYINAKNKKKKNEMIKKTDSRDPSERFIGAMRRKSGIWLKKEESQEI